MLERCVYKCVRLMQRWWWAWLWWWSWWWLNITRTDDDASTTYTKQYAWRECQTLREATRVESRARLSVCQCASSRLRVSWVSDWLNDGRALDNLWCARQLNHFNQGRMWWGLQHTHTTHQNSPRFPLVVIVRTTLTASFNEMYLIKCYRPLLYIHICYYFKRLYTIVS